MKIDIKKIALMLLICSIFSCGIMFNNPVDPQSDSYQGYETVNNVNDLKSYELEELFYSEPPYLTVSELRGALKYRWQLSQNEFYMDGGEIYQTYTNKFQPDKADLEGGYWYWRAKAVDANGHYGEWTEVRKFHMDSFWKY